ncbi:STAS domain-containing protein [Paractinoplanes lichenicola]|uniref:STAS domain-containing protein n=1 Tax=Paractinoplanes lichenicola TaxID=2802976 RepID=A0ABS1W0J3_9ACTN|nr:STAS domain-containing protein [Actinoplanes lichenicola]MBL7260258.1 STAS domain-containing protein [Actinoplanes lichenicola]
MTIVPSVHGAGFSTAVTPEAALVRVTGDIDLDVIGELREALDNAVALRPVVIVDLISAGTIDSLGLAVLTGARDATRRHGGDLLLVASSHFTRGVLTARRLQTAFRVYDTVPQAITAASGPR